jgi:ribonucleotide reductase alpha subunit
MAFGALSSKQMKDARHPGSYTAIFNLDNYLGLENTGRLYTVPGRAANIFSARDNTEARAALHFVSDPLDYDRRDAEQHRRIVAEHQQVGREGAERFFMDPPTQEILDMMAENAPEVTRTEIVKLRDYALGS